MSKQSISKQNHFITLHKIKVTRIKSFSALVISMSDFSMAALASFWAVFDPSRASRTSWAVPSIALASRLEMNFFYYESHHFFDTPFDHHIKFAKLYHQCLNQALLTLTSLWKRNGLDDQDKVDYSPEGMTFYTKYQIVFIFVSDMQMFIKLLLLLEVCQAILYDVWHHTS